jgi:hypothetical protein
MQLCYQDRYGSFGSGIRVIQFAHLRNGGSLDIKRVSVLRENKPVPGSFSLTEKFVNIGKTRKMPVFGSFGKYTQISSCLPKYD